MCKKQLTRESTLKEILACYDNKKMAFAKAIGVTKQYISQLDENEPLPQWSYLKFRHEVRPDLYIAEVDIA